ncbi:MAG: UPF0316 protein [Vicingaceae bacterium]|jgi:uncharacterized protein YebE (UPF0316 family)|nr:MAG: UPF0316 protein [Vicingaceae bacterium]
MHESWIYEWVFIPGLIFLARLTDVSLATVRHILVYRGQKKIVPIIGFFEVLIWLMAITQVMNHLNNPVSYLAWAFGFATGTRLGMVIEEKIAIGYALIRIIFSTYPDEIIPSLKNKKIGFTIVRGEGALGPVYVMIIVTKRKFLSDVINIIKQNDENTFYTIEDIKLSEKGIFPASSQFPFFNRK